MRVGSLAGAIVFLGVGTSCSSTDSPPSSAGAGGTAAGVAGHPSGAGTASGGSGGRAATGGSGGAGVTAGRGGTAAGHSGDSGAGGSGNLGGTGAGGTAGSRANGGRSGAGSGGGGRSARGGSGTQAGEAGTGGGTPADPPTAPTSCDDPAWNPADFDTVLEVGPGLAFETPSDVPWESITAGTLVRIHHRAEPYRDKWVINTTGTADKPVVVLGVPENGELPVISGDGATTRSALDYWNEPRGIVKIGAANRPSGPAAHVTVECLEVTTARPGVSFDDAEGNATEYAQNAACLYLEEGSFITLRNNVIHGCGNGIFSSSGSSDVLVASNYVYENGNDGSIYEHNSYTEALGITFEFNHYGPLCGTCEGNNLKDRSAGTVIRYNWIESGNRQLDLVESDHDELVNDPRYHSTFVYGNVLVEPDAAGNSQIIHYGGDGDDESMYRKGTLYFYGNTVASTRHGNTTLFRLSSEEESVDARNNIASVMAGGSTLAISAGMGAIHVATNWLPAGWVESHDTLTGSIEESGNVVGAAAGFVDEVGQDFTLQGTSPCIGAAGPLADAASGNPVVFEYVRYQNGKVRAEDGDSDIGAYEAD